MRWPGTVLFLLVVIALIALCSPRPFPLFRHFFDEEATIDVTLKPLKFATKVGTFPPGSHGVGSVLAINLCFLLGFIWPALSIYLIRERRSTLKKQQFLAGAKFVTYWTYTLLYDLLLLVLHTLALLVMVAIYLHPVHNVSFYCKCHRYSR